MRTYEFVIGVAETGMRLDQYLTRRLPASVSRAMIQRAIREGLVTVEGRTVRVHHKLHRGDRIEARFTSLPSPPKDITLMPQAIPLDVVYEDAELLVVNKPAGLVTHPAPGHWDGTLVNAILWHLEQTGGRRTKAEGQETERCEPASALRPPPRAGIIHRLDKDTSGLLLVAKTEEAHVALSRQLKARTVNRRYLALVEGHLPLHMGTINAPIGRHATHRKVMTVRHLGGRSAVTHYRVIKRLGAEGSRLKAEASSLQPPAFSYTLVEVSLETGRTHQIRVHMAHVGHPVLGDTAYGKRPAAFWRTVGVARQMLHAFHLAFQHPRDGRLVTLTAPVPEDMARWFPHDLPERRAVAMRHSN